MQHKSIFQRLSHPSQLMAGIVIRLHRFFPNDKRYLKLLYRLYMGKKLDLKTPKTFTEKLQWLKLYDRRPEYKIMVDKYAVKQYVADKIGAEYIIPTLGIWNTPEEIDWDALPHQFVLKTTHGGGGGGVVFCRNKDTINKEKVVLRLKKQMNLDVYGTLREWPYKGIPHRIIAEQLLEKDPQYNDIPDYKFYCFNGEPKVLLIASNRYTKGNYDYFDMEFRKLPITSTAGSNSEIVFSKPACFEEMKNIASILSKGFYHIRVDLYSVSNKVYFGELTFFDSSGYDNLNSDTIDLEWGSWIKLPVNE